MARVTSKDFAERLRRSVEQAVAIEQGEREAGSIVRRKLAGRETVIEMAPQLAPEKTKPAELA
ncbi:hypothetical protein [Longimicrobium sp.]|jgi:hypothetical protein|uniref:hypothetical protein n=1 Tax=Longimicrobium sp. TaxID=2029185 RepID=UPI002ED94805